MSELKRVFAQRGCLSIHNGAKSSAISEKAYGLEVHPRRIMNYDKVRCHPISLFENSKDLLKYLGGKNKHCLINLSVYFIYIYILLYTYISVLKSTSVFL